MALEVFESTPGGDPESRRPTWAARDSQFVPNEAPQSVQDRRAQAVRTSLANDSLVPTVPDDIQHVRRRNSYIINEGTDDELVLEEPKGLRERGRAIVPLLSGLGEDVMLLEAMGSRAFGATDAGATPTVVHDHSERKKRVMALAHKRDEAICKAGVGRDKAMDRVFRLDAVVRKYAPFLQAAKDKGNTAEAEKWAAKIAKIILLRDIVAGRAVRFAKVQALGQAMAKTATTEANLLTLAEMASKKGLPAEAQTLTKAADLTAAKDAHFGDLRKKQIANWTVQAASAEKKAVTLLLGQKTRDIKQLEATPVAASMAGEKERQLVNLRVEQSKLANKLEELKTKLSAAGVKELEQNGSPIETKAKLAEAFLGLEALGFSITGALRKVGGAISDAASSVKGAVVDAAKAGVALAKKGACAIASNPKVAQAAGAAIGTAIGGPAGTMAGAAGAKGATSLISSACGSAAVAPPPAPLQLTALLKSAQTFNLNRTSTVTVPSVAAKSIAVPVAIGGAGLVALLLLL